jgi:hypothetical protein
MASMARTRTVAAPKAENIARAILHLRGQRVILDAELALLFTEHGAITAIRSTIRELMHPPTPARRGIGFTADLESKK